MATLFMDIYTLVGIGIFAASVFVAEEVVSLVVRRTARTARAGPTVIRDIKTGLRLVAVALIVSDALGASGLSSVFTTLTVSGVLAIAISLALQTTLSNVISGLLLFSDGVLRLGDTIEYGGNKGKVVRIGLRNTWIKTDGPGSLVVISNSSLSGGPLRNHTATERLTRKYAFE